MSEQIKVIFNRVYVLNDEDWCGNGEFYFIASVDGVQVGNPKQIFEAIERQWILLPQPQWSRIIDVTGKNKVVVRFKGKEQDFLWDDDLGPELQYTLKPPWDQGLRPMYATEDYKLEWSVELETDGKFGLHPADEIFACRSHAGSDICTTVEGKELTSRLEFHPVIPMPSDAAPAAGSPVVFPPRPAFPAGTAPAVYNPNNAGINVTAVSDINVIPNPAVVPILSPPGPAPAAGSPTQATAQNAARIEYTYYRPDALKFTDADPRLQWDAVPLAGGAAVSFLGSSTGRKILAYGTTPGEVLLRVRFRGVILATYRALVSKVKQVPCRFNILNGPTAASQPRSTPADVQTHLAIANRFLRQLAIELVLDTNLSAKNGAVVAKDAAGNPIPGIFRIHVSAGTTRNISLAGFVAATRLNYRPNVMNFAYIHSVSGGGILGAADNYPANGAGASIIDSGTPSSSWNIPSGILPDAAAGTVTLTLLAARQQPGHPQLFAMYVTNGNGLPGVLANDQTYAGTIAHEFGHILNLGHRVDSPGSPFNDGVNHPPNENVMHWNNPTTLAQDFDIVQARAVFRSPLVPP